MDLNLNFERIASLSASDEAGLVERIAISKAEKQRKKGQKRLKSIQKKQKRDFQSLPQSQREKTKNPPPGTSEFKNKFKKPGEKPAAGPKKKRPPKPGSKRALREEALAKVPADPDKGKAYCVQQTSPKNGHPMIWVRPTDTRRQFCRSLGPREVRRLRKKLRNKAKGKGDEGSIPRSLRQLLKIMKGVRPDIAAGETMGDLAIRRRMRRQLGNILMHGGMSKERLTQVSKGNPQAIKAFKKMMSGRGMGQFGMQDMTDSKKMAEHFNDFMETADAYGVDEALSTQKQLNMEANKAFRSSKGKRGDGFAKLRMENAKRRGESKKRRQEDDAALADTELSGPSEDPGVWREDMRMPEIEEPDWDAVSGDPTEEDLAGPREGGGAQADADEDAATRRRLGLPPRKAASEPLLRAATQKFLKRRTVTAAVTVTESYDEFNPMVAEGSWKAMQVYAMYRADCHANLDRIAAKAFLLTD